MLLKVERGLRVLLLELIGMYERNRMGQLGVLASRSETAMS